MPQTQLRPPALVTRNGLGNVICSAALDAHENTFPLLGVQAAFFASRFGFDGARARLMAELAWGSRGRDHDVLLVAVTLDRTASAGAVRQ